MPASSIHGYISSIKQVVFAYEISTEEVCDNLQKAEILSVTLSILSFIGICTLLLGTREMVVQHENRAMKNI